MSTSKLQRYVGDKLDKYLPEFRIRENYRPDWLMFSEGSFLELDFYIEELNIAIEVQGDQHYCFIPFFHKDISEFRNSQKRDAEKKDLCKGHGCKFVEIMTQSDIDIFISNLIETIQKNSPNISTFYYQPDPKAFDYLSKKKKRNTNPDYEKEERLSRCIENIRLYEIGQLQASDDKVKNWRRVVESNGKEDNWGIQ